MMEDKTVSLLLVEPDPQDARFVVDVLGEIEQRQYGRAWSPVFAPVCVERLSDAMAVLADQRFEVALLDVALPDSRALHALLRLKTAAPLMPILLLADADDEALALSAVREGAQDYLVKAELDCAPLARALRHAVERQRLSAAAQSAAFQDAETGFYTSSAFQSLASRDMRLARQSGCDLHVVVWELNGLERMERAYGRSERALLLMEASDVLRAACGANDIVGRLNGSRFAVATIERGAGSSRVLRELRAGRGGRRRIETSTGAVSMRECGAPDWESLLAAAEKSLCENRRRSAAA